MLCSLAFDGPPISDYLEAFYGGQGGVESEYLEGARFVLHECVDCRAVYQRDIPDGFLMERLYERWIDPVRARDAAMRMDYEKFGVLASYAQEVMQIVAWLGVRPEGLRVLDHGMGWGRWALMAKAFGCRAYGTELSASRIEYARRNGIEVVSLDQVGGFEFDFINTEQVFEHLPRPLETLRALRRVLSENGILKISVPKANGLDRRLRSMRWECSGESRHPLNAVAPLEHINCFRRSSLLAMARRAGMEPVAMPIALQYAFETNWYGGRAVLKNLARPVYRNLFKQQNHVFLKASRAEGADR